VTSAELGLKDLREIEHSDCRRRYTNPLNLLFLLPGVLFFILAVATRNSGKAFLFFGLLFLLASGDPGHFAAIRQAQESYASGRYAEALEIYKQVEQDMPCNSAVLYNLGILSHHLGEKGYAVHYLRRSLRQAPADRQARSALKVLEQSYGLAGQVALPVPVHPDIAYLLMLVLTNAAFVMGAYVVRSKKIGFIIALVLVAIAALGCSAFFVGRLLAESRSVGVVSFENSELYRIPERDSKSWFQLPMGTSLWIRGRSGQYYLVETPSQIEGWVRKSLILID
jgi:tetratricopeptide (TPR) repeat protein